MLLLVGAFSFCGNCFISQELYNNTWLIPVWAITTTNAPTKTLLENITSPLIPKVPIRHHWDNTFPHSFPSLVWHWNTLCASIFNTETSFQTLWTIYTMWFLEFGYKNILEGREFGKILLLISNLQSKQSCLEWHFRRIWAK